VVLFSGSYPIQLSGSFLWVYSIRSTVYPTELIRFYPLINPKIYGFEKTWNFYFLMIIAGLLFVIFILAIILKNFFRACVIEISQNFKDCIKETNFKIAIKNCQEIVFIDLHSPNMIELRLNTKQSPTQTKN